MWALDQGLSAIVILRASTFKSVELAFLATKPVLSFKKKNTLRFMLLFSPPLINEDVTFPLKTQSHTLVLMTEHTVDVRLHTYPTQSWT